MCPSITIDDPIILVPSGTKKAVRVNVLIREVCIQFRKDN